MTHCFCNIFRFRDSVQCRACFRIWAESCERPSSLRGERRRSPKVPSVCDDLWRWLCTQRRSEEILTFLWSPKHLSHLRLLNVDRFDIQGLQKDFLDFLKDGVNSIGEVRGLLGWQLLAMSYNLSGWLLSLYSLGHDFEASARIYTAWPGGDLNMKTGFESDEANDQQVGMADAWRKFRCSGISSYFKTDACIMHV